MSYISTKFCELCDEHYDWVICSNPESHRAGLLTFEHQGCFKFEEDIEDV